jgi:hypothetical protein
LHPDSPRWIAITPVAFGTKLYAGFGALVAAMIVLVAVASGNFSRLAQANSWNIHT